MFLSISITIFTKTWIKRNKFEQTTRRTSTSTSTSTYSKAKVTPAPTSTQSNASNANTHETIPWWQVPPEPGASQVKSIRVKSGSNSGRIQTRKWCQTCKKWTFHSPEGHDEWMKNKQTEDKDKRRPVIHIKETLLPQVSLQCPATT